MRKRLFYGTNFFAVIFFIGLVAGAVLVNLAKQETVSDAFIYTDLYFEILSERRIPSYVTASEILKHAFRFYLLIFLASFTKWKQIGKLICCIYFGFSFGVMIADLTVLYGIAGILIFFVCVLGQFIYYALTTAVLLSGSTGGRDMQRAGRYRLSFVFLFMGMILEFVNQIHLLPKIIQLVG